jgi:hypothetical protein
MTSWAFVLRQVRVVHLDQCRAAQWRFRLPGSRREYPPGRHRGVIVESGDQGGSLAIGCLIAVRARLPVVPTSSPSLP